MTSVGGCNGTYDHPGTHKGLSDALKKIGEDIAASDDPCGEEFILFVSDHGDIHRMDVTVPHSTLPNSTSVYSIQPWPIPLDPMPWLDTPDNVTSVSFFVPLGAVNSRVHNLNFGDLFHPGNWTVQVIGMQGPLNLTQFVETHVEFNDIFIGNRPLEGVRLSFPIPEQLFMDSFFDVFVCVQVTNRTSRPWTISNVSLDSGNIQKGNISSGCPADFNNDGAVDFFDYDDFVFAFELGLPTADFNHDSAIDFFDYDEFVIAFEIGC